jgi:hypothetical protein
VRFNSLTRCLESLSRDVHGETALSTNLYLWEPLCEIEGDGHVGLPRDEVPGLGTRG